MTSNALRDWCRFDDRLMTQRGTMLASQPARPTFGEPELQPLILGLELLQALHIVGLHPAVLIAPTVIGRLGELQLLDDLRQLLTLAEQPVGLPQLANDLLRRVCLRRDMYSLLEPIRQVHRSSHNTRTDPEGSGQGVCLSRDRCRHRAVRGQRDP
jgi:hypothetical protein